MKYLALSFISIICSLAHSQSLVIKDQNNNVLNSATVTIAVPNLSAIVSANYNVFNTSGGTLAVRARRVENSIVPGSTNYFCWAGSCYAAQTSVSPFPANIMSNQSSPFIGDYEPDGNAGASTITYIFSDVNNSSDSAFVTVIYSTQVAGIKKQAVDNPSISLYPNPSTEKITVTLEAYDFKPATAKLIDLNGKEIQNTLLENPKTEIDLKNLATGKYLLQIVQENKLYQKTFIKS